MRLRFVAGFICEIKPDTQISVKCKPTEQKNRNNYQNEQYFSKTEKSQNRENGELY